MKRPKYGNVKVDGYDSKREARFARQLDQMRLANDPAERVVEVREQVRFELIPPQCDDKGRLVERKCEYVADFVVRFANGVEAVFDAKGVRTDVYVMKRKLMLQVFGIRIREV